MTPPPAVLILGDVMRDIVVRLGGPLRAGTDQHARIAMLPGGAAANLAVCLAGQGQPVRLLACVGAADVEAERRRLDGHGVMAHLVPHPDLPTGSLVALVDAEGDRSFLTDRGANDGLLPTLLPADALDGAGHLHVSGYAFVGAGTRASALHLIGQARARGLPVSVDPGSSGFIADLGADAVLSWSAGATLLVVNEAEAAALTGVDDPERQLAALTGRFERVILKQGAQGAILAEQGGARYRAPAPAVAVVDTIGAGDAFLAGFLAATLAGAAAPEALAAAVRLGSQSTTRAGGQPPMPDP